MIIAQVCLRLATIKGHSERCSFITQHNATDVVRFEGACNWHADCRSVHPSGCRWIECSFLYHKPSSKPFQRIWQYIQPASQLQTTCNHTSPGPPHPASSPPRSSETSHPGQLLQQSVCITKEFLHKLSQRSSSACSSSSSGSRPDCSSSSEPTWVGKCSHSMASGTLERCSLHGWILVFTVQGRWQTAFMVSCGWAVCWCQGCGSSGPWWRWGSGMGSRMLWTMNTDAFYWWYFECTDIPWRDPEAHWCAIHPQPSPHIAAW